MLQFLLSHDIAPNPIHSSLHLSSYGIPIGSPLGEFIDLFCAKYAVEALRVRDECSQSFCFRRVDEIELCEFTECDKVQEEGFVAKGGDVGVVVGHIAEEGKEVRITSQEILNL